MMFMDRPGGAAVNVVLTDAVLRISALCIIPFGCPAILPRHPLTES